VSGAVPCSIFPYVFAQQQLSRLGAAQPADDAQVRDPFLVPGCTDAESHSLWKGSITQESASAVTILDNTSYDGAGYQTFGFEMHADRDNGYITWNTNRQPSWTLNAAAFAPNEATQVGCVAAFAFERTLTSAAYSQRLISEEPMYIVGVPPRVPGFQLKTHTAFELVHQLQVPGQPGLWQPGLSVNVR
jgi:hypothetical protein